MAETFETFVAKERERLTTRRNDLLEKQRQLEQDLKAVDQEMYAIEAYEAAKQGKLPRQRGGGTRARRGSKREKVYEVVAASPSGLTRGEAIEALGVKGDKPGEDSVTNSLTALKKAKRLNHTDDGKYHAI